MKDEEIELGSYEELFSTFDDVSDYTSYLYKKQDGSKHYGWIATYDDCLPEFDEIAAKYGDGRYRLNIFKQNREEKTQIKVSRAFIIDSYHHKKNETQKSEVKELIDSILPFLKREDPQKQLISQVNFVEDIMKNQVKNYSEIMKDIRQNQFQEYQEEGEGEEGGEVEGEENEVNINFIYPILDQYLPLLIGEGKGEAIKQLVSNPIAKGVINHIFSNAFQLQKVKKYLIKKIGEDATNSLINTINK